MLGPATAGWSDYVGTAAAEDAVATLGSPSLYELAGVDRERARLGAGGEQQLAVADARAVCEAYDVRVGVDRRHCRVGDQVDVVVVVEPAEVVRAEPAGHRALFVALTRPTRRLVIVHAEPLPAPLVGA